MPSVDREDQPRRHKQQFKNTSRHEDARRRRNETSVELRKNKKEEQLMKRRNIDDTAPDQEPVSSPEKEKGGDCVVPSAAPTLSLEECAVIVQKRQEARYPEAVLAVRKVLSRQNNPPIQQVVDQGFIPFLIAALEAPPCALEAAWALTNVLSGSADQTQACVRQGVVPGMVRLLASPDPETAEQAVWALGNIAGDSSEMRDIVLQNGALPLLLHWAAPETGIAVGFARTLTWAMSNLCRHRSLQLETAEQLLPALGHLVRHPDAFVTTDACWALGYLSDGRSDVVNAVVDANMLPLLVEYLGREETSVVAPVLRALGNIVTGTDAQTQAVLQAGILQGPIQAMLNSERPHLRKEAAWLISNVAAGTSEQISALVEAGVIPLIVELLRMGDFRTQVEAAYVLTNITTGGTQDQISYMVTCGALQGMCGLLTAKDSKLVGVLLDGLANILRVAEDADQLEAAAVLVEDCGGLDALEELQKHDNEQIYHQAVHILENYFGAADEADTSAVNGEQVPEGGFNF